MDLIHPRLMDDRSLLAIFALVAIWDEEERKSKRRKPRIWSPIWLLERPTTSHIHLLRTMEENDLKNFTNFVRMYPDDYYTLLDMVQPYIIKLDTQIRKAITPHERLSLTLRFLASGNSYEDLKFLTRIASNTIGIIVMETCEAIIAVLTDYITLPRNELEWRVVAEAYADRLDYPHCLGAIDGKHIAIRQPAGDPYNYLNYKGFHSVVLLAVADANCKFLMVDVGGNGANSDWSLFRNTEFFSKLVNHGLNLPQSDELPGVTHRAPYVFLADSGFPLMERMMTRLEFWKEPNVKKLTTDGRHELALQLSVPLDIRRTGSGYLRYPWL